MDHLGDPSHSHWREQCHACRSRFRFCRTSRFALSDRSNRLLVGTYLLLGRGIQAILQMNSIVVPMMLLLSLLMITSTIHHPGASRFITLTTDSNPIQVWLSPLLYTSFNLALAQAVLVPVGNQIRSRNVLKWGGVLGGIGVGFMLMAAHFAMSAQMPGIINSKFRWAASPFNLDGQYNLYMYPLFLWKYSVRLLRISMA